MIGIDQLCGKFVVDMCRKIVNSITSMDCISTGMLPWILPMKIGAAAITSGWLGWILINSLRRISREKSANYVYLCYVPIVAPIVVYTVFCLGAWCLGIEAFFADCSAFGFMIGMLWRLSYRSSGIDTIRLCVHEPGDVEYTEVWIKNADVTVSEGIDLIAEALHVKPANRVSIESGRGKFIDSPSAALVPALTGGAFKEDVFGFSTVHCYVNVKGDEAEPDLPDGDVARRGSIIAGMLPHHGRSAVRYGLDVSLSGKIPNAANDSKAFNISSVELYAAAAPSENTDTVRFVGWRETDGESNSLAKFEASLSGQKLHNGDCVVLENHGKFMSVVRGWWIAWSSSVPRRSGAFRIEIIERASLNTLEKGVEVFKERILKKEDDNSVRVGDVFRLRSVKFPGFELGVTGVRLTDDYFHLGLRKIDEDNPNWCLPLQFTCKVKKDFLL